MKLSMYAKKKGISYLTALRHWQKGYLQGEQLPSGTIKRIIESIVII
jgi:predicted site-specific integrase-resolvase